MLAIGLGHAAIDAGHRVDYTTAADLVARKPKAAIEGRWADTLRFFAARWLLIIDEFGYLSMTCEAAASLFQLVNRRYAVGALAGPTTNHRCISRWGQTFDAPVAATVPDQLMYRSVIVPIDDDSYRMRTH
jgi:DNA replication protein DnaC